MIFRYVDELESRVLDSYSNLDMRMSWKPVPELEFSVVGQNLLEDHHSEFTIPNFVHTLHTDVERAFYGMTTLRF